jgi:microcompartment protein CcmL/EutN
MELLNYFTQAMKFSRLLSRHVIANPFDQVLQSVVVHSGVQDWFNKVFVFAIDLNWW